MKGEAEGTLFSRRARRARPTWSSQHPPSIVFVFFVSFVSFVDHSAVVVRGQMMSESEADVRRIPEQAQRRLAEMRGQEGGPPRLFTSDLSVNEFLMVEEAGFEPLGFVMGSSFFHIGIQWTMQPFQNYELDVLTAALYHAREYAMARMEEEAHILGADGIVGVRLEVGKHDWAERS